MSSPLSISPPGGRDSKPPAPPRVPDHELIRRIGKGAYGEVWLARCTLGTYRAVKIVHRRSFDHDRPFEREFEGNRKFEPISRTHESQVDILHVGRNGDCFYYVMELADDQATGGQINPDNYAPRTIKSDLQFHGRLSFEECVRIGIALATALEHLHANGLVHRDVKPSNIIFVNGVPKLADIGLVTNVDATRSYVGTEGFAAPEGAGTPRADLFSLGKVLYEIATGKDRQEFPELPTMLRELPDREGLMELNAVIAKACRHDPKDRYASAAQMRADLELLQSGKSLARLRRTQERLRFVQRAGAAVTALAALIAAGWLWQARQTHFVRDLAADKARLAEEKAKLADENRERLAHRGIANGVREMELGDFGPALVWLTDALMLTSNKPADAAIQRVRISQVLAQHPRLLHVFPHPAAVHSAEFSPDERQVVTACEDGRIRLWDVDQDEKPAKEYAQSGPVSQVRFTRDGKALFVLEPSQLKQPGRVALLEADTGRPLFPPILGLTTAALSPDDRWLAVARADSTIEVIATASGRVVTRAVGHTDRVEAMGFSPDSSQLITASRDRTVRRWAVTTGVPLGSPLRHDYPVARASFNSDASRIASATIAEQSNDPIQFQTWNAATGAAMGNPIRGQGLHSLLAFDPSGRRLLTADRDSVARAWNADSHSAILPPLRMEGSGRCVDFSPDGAWVAIGSEAGTVRIWDFETGSLALSPLRNAGRIESMRFNGAGSGLLTASDDGAVKLWDLALASADRSVLIPSPERPSAALVSNDRQMLLGVSGGARRLHLLDLNTLKPDDESMPGATNSAASGILVVDRAGDQWASVVGPVRYRNLRRPTEDSPSTAGLWRREQGQIRYFALPHPTQARDAFFHRDGRRLLTVGADRTTRIWNTADGLLQQTIRWPEPDAAWIGVSPDLSTAVVLCGNEQGWGMAFRDVQTGQMLRELPEPNPDIRAVAFSPDGTQVGLVGGDQSGRIWDVRSGEPLSPPFVHGGTLLCIEWSPDGRRVLTAGLSPDVKVWDAGTGEMALPPLRMKTRPVELARFSPDGWFIVARSDDEMIRVWDAATGEAVTPLVPHRDTIKDVFVTAAQQLVSVQNSGEVRAWDLTEATGSARDLSDYACLLSGGTFKASDSLAPVGANELATLLRSLRARQPSWFDPSLERLREWHRSQVRAPYSLDKVQAALFHLERSARMAPQDKTIQEQLDRHCILLIPPRDPATPRHLLDLTRAYTHSFGLLARGEFAELPRGRQTLGGTEFDLRGFVHLDHRAGRSDAVGPFHSMAVVEVGLRCRTLHFLQATTDDPWVEGSTVARWLVHYADGSAREWPVIYGEHIRDLWWSPQKEPLEARQASVAWRGRAAIGDLSGRDGVLLYKATWTNPQPEMEITRLEFRVGETSMKPLVVAVTAE